MNKPPVLLNPKPAARKMRRGPRPRAITPVAQPTQSPTDRATVGAAVVSLVASTLADWLASGKVVIVTENGKRKVKKAAGR